MLSSIAFDPVDFIAKRSSFNRTSMLFIVVCLVSSELMRTIDESGRAWMMEQDEMTTDRGLGSYLVRGFVQP